MPAAGPEAAPGGGGAGRRRAHPHRMSLPTPALDSLLMAVEEAVTLALEGDAAAGYELLITSRAGALEGERNFEPWAETLERLWDRA